MDDLQQFDLALKISPVPMLLAAEDGRIVLTNTDLDSLFDFPPEGLIGEHIDTLIPQEHREHHDKLRMAYFRVPSNRKMGAGRELHGITRKGEIVPLELGLQPVSLKGKTYALVAALDLRQRKAQERRMRLAMDATASAMVMVGQGGTISFVNNSACTLFGYGEEELLGERINMLIPERFHHAHPVYVSSYFSSGSARLMSKSNDLAARHKSGREIPVQVALTPVENSNPKVVMATIIDLSERVAAARAMATKNEELAALNVELSHFANSASHDLKAPLSTITGLVGICLEDLEESNFDELRTNLDNIKHISSRSAKKVEGILAVARAGRDPLPVETIEIEPLVDEIWLDLTGQNTSVRLAKQLGAGARITTELPTLRVILENLLSNALRYDDPTKDNHQVAISCSANESECRISVEDNGIGIPEKNHKKLFHLFKRLDERSGDGLGLALVQKQVERLGGEISFSSYEGKGAKFTVILPDRTEDHDPD